MKIKLLCGCNIAAALFKTGFRSGHHVLEIDADRTAGFNGNATVNQCALPRKPYKWRMPWPS